MLSARPDLPRPAPGRNADAPVAAPDTTALREVAARCGLAFFDDAYATQSRVDGAAEPTLERLSAGAVAMLPGEAVLTLSGDDALRFLHSQTTNDVEHQLPGEARWHGYCSAKGRLLATLLAWRDDACIRLLLPDSIAEPIRKRLAMFVLRSKVRITDDRGSLAVLGLVGAAAPAALGALGLNAPSALQVSIGALEALDAPDDAQANARRAASGPGGAWATVIGLPSIDVPPSPREHATAARSLPRWLLIVPVPSLVATWSVLARTLAPIASPLWRWGAVRAGIAAIVPATSEQFVPQMLNLEAVGGVSFTKGCYPGQEIVARSHYLGKLKRRMFLGHLAEPATEPAPGTDVADEKGEPLGKVVVAARTPYGGVDLLFEAQVSAAHSTRLCVAGAEVRLLELPYPLPAA